MNLRRVGAFIVPAIATVVLSANAIYVPFDSLRLGAVLLVLTAVQLMLWPRFRPFRELRLYALFTVYTFVTLLWTPDPLLGLNTLAPSVDCVIVMVLFGSIGSHCDTRTVVSGMLCGALIAGGGYSLLSGFPFAYPEDFSYNAVASMYLFGLVTVALFGAVRGSRLVPLAVTVIFLVCVAATTSIKTNLGIALGAGAAFLVYFRNSLRLLRRTAIPLVMIGAAAAYVGVSSDSIVERVQVGLGRVAAGAVVLAARGDDINSVGIGFSTRENWETAGIRGWARSPLLGNGVEAFRADVGVTSHSTPVDVLYNSGIIGLILFYACLGSVAWRLLFTRHSLPPPLRAAVLAALSCYTFVSLSGIMHYNELLLAFVALSAQWLERAGGLDTPPSASLADGRA